MPRKPYGIRVSGHFLCSVFVPCALKGGHICYQFIHPTLDLFVLGIHIALTGEADVIVSQLAFDGFIVQLRVVHEGRHSMPSPPVDAFDVKVYAAEFYGLINAVV